MQISLPGTALRASWGRLGLLAITLAAFLLRTWDLDRLPPGLFFDETFNAVDAQQVLAGVTPFFFTGNNGREPLFIYLQAAALSGLGSSAYILRLVAAAAGVLTIPVTALLAWRLLNWSGGGLQLAGQRQSALLAAASLSVLYWHVSLSRLGFRVILLPLLSTLAFYFLARAWQQNRRADFVWAGFWLGAAQYTYIAARLLPLVVGGFILVELLRASRAHSFSPRLPGLGWLALSATLVAAPLLWTFSQQPDLLAARTGDVSIFTPPSPALPGTPGERLIGNLGGMVSAFFVGGDLNPRHNLPGRPINDPLLALLFVAGLATCLARIRQPAHHLVLLWFVVMLTPSIFSVESPHWLRMAGALPPLVVLYAAGAQELAVRLARWLAPARLLALLLAGLLAGSGGVTAYSYFSQWAQLPVLAGSFDADQYEAAAAVRTLLATEPARPLLLTRRLFRSPQMRFLNPDLPAAAPLLAGPAAPQPVAAGTRYLVELGADPNQPLFLLTRSAAGTLAVTQLAPYTAPGNSLVDAVLNRTLPSSPLPGLTNRQPTHLYSGELPALQLPVDRVEYPLEARFANGIELLGYSLPLDAISCTQRTLPLTLFLRQPTSGSTDETVLFAHLMLPDGQLQDNELPGDGYPSPFWRPGETVDDRRSFVLPQPLTSGKAYFEAGFFQQLPDGSLQRVQRVDSRGNPAGDQLVFGPLAVCEGPPPASLDDLVPLRARFEERIELAGLQVAPLSGSASALQITLGWRALDRSPTDYTAFVHLLDANGTLVSQLDSPPGGADNPTTLWVPGEQLRSTFILPLPAGLDRAALQKGYQLRVGLYEPVSGRQLALLFEPESPATFLLLPLGEFLP